MSVGKTALRKRLLISALLMAAVLLAVIGVCASLMSGGIIDHRMTTQSVCVAWGIAAMTAAAYAARIKDAAAHERWLAPLTILVLALSVSLTVGKEHCGDGLWWKCSMSAIAGMTASSLLVSKKSKKYKSRGGERKKAKRR